MCAQIGNQNAVGSSYDLDEETRALDQWSKRDDAVALVHFCVERDIYAQRVYEWRDKSPSFAEALKRAQTRIAARVRDKLQKNETNYGLFMREIGYHDKFLHDYEEGIKDKDAKRAKAIEEVKVDELKVHMTAFLDMIKAVQPAQQSSVNSSLNKADINIKTDNMS